MHTGAMRERERWGAGGGAREKTEESLYLADNIAGAVFMKGA